MEDDLAAIWVRIGKKTTKPLHIGGLYRKHKLPNQGTMNREELLQKQRERWDRLTANWAKAAKNARCVLLGDTNLDFMKWNDPDPALASMVARTKATIEKKGSTQLIQTCNQNLEQTERILLGPNLAKL